MSHNSVVITDLTIGYRERRRDVVVAEGLNGTVRGGSLTCLIGANGVGKSTLLKTLSAFIPKLGGGITLCGRALDGYSPRELARTVGVVLTSRPDTQNMTVTETVALGRSPYTGFFGTLTDEDRRLVDDAISLVGISQLRDRRTGTLSDGECQRMMIAKAIAQDTPVIFLDEPTAFLDFPGKVSLMRLLSRIAHETGKTIFLSTHDVAMALHIADQLWLMLPDHTLRTGTPRELASDGSISSFLDRDGIVFHPDTLTIGF